MMIYNINVNDEDAKNFEYDNNNINDSNVNINDSNTVNLLMTIKQ